MYLNKFIRHHSTVCRCRLADIFYDVFSTKVFIEDMLFARRVDKWQQKQVFLVPYFGLGCRTYSREGAYWSEGAHLTKYGVYSNSKLGYCFPSRIPCITARENNRLFFLNHC